MSWKRSADRAGLAFISGAHIRARTGGKLRLPAVTQGQPKTISDLGTRRLTPCLKRPSKGLEMNDTLNRACWSG